MSDVPPPPPGSGAGSVPPPPPTTPPPPPPGAAAVPPPPPTGLTAPPGYVGYAPTAMTSVRGLHRIGKLTTAAVVLVCISALVSLLSILTIGAARDDAQALLDDRIDVEEFVQGSLLHLLIGVVQGVAVLAAAVVTMIWMYRITKNHRTLHRGGTWGPGWAIGGWFLPPLVLYIIPFLMFRELWKASDPDTPVGGEWKANQVAPIVTIWFVLYGLAPLAVFALQSGGGVFDFGATERDLAQQIVDGRPAVIVGALVATAGAAAFTLMAVGLSRRHRQLTGESAAAVQAS